MIAAFRALIAAFSAHILTGAEALNSFSPFQNKKEERTISVMAAANRAVAHLEQNEKLDRCELDSHADTCVAGGNMLLIAEQNRSVTVSGFTKEFTKLYNIPIGTAVTLWQNPTDSQIYALVFHEALYFGDRLGASSLLNPNQMRKNGLIVEDIPRHLDVTGCSRHAIIVPRAQNLKIDLSLDGVISGFTSVKPSSIAECEGYPQIEMTSNVHWNPRSSDFAANERLVKLVERPSGLMYDSGLTME